MYTYIVSHTTNVVYHIHLVLSLTHRACMHETRTSTSPLQPELRSPTTRWSSYSLLFDTTLSRPPLLHHRSFTFANAVSTSHHLLVTIQMFSGLSRANRFKTAAAVSAFGLTLYSLPMLLHTFSSAPKIDSSKPLKPEAIRRGAFNNSGTRDIGPEYVVYLNTFSCTSNLANLSPNPCRLHDAVPSGRTEPFSLNAEIPSHRILNHNI